MIASFMFILAFFLRLYYLDLFPLNHDEAPWTVGSLYNFDKFLGIPVACLNGYIQPFFSYLVFLSRKIFTSPKYIIRMPSVIIGTLTVVLLYISTKEMHGKRAGLISAAILCFLELIR